MTALSHLLKLLLAVTLVVGLAPSLAFAVESSPDQGATDTVALDEATADEKDDSIDAPAAIEDADEEEALVAAETLPSATEEKVASVTEAKGPVEAEPFHYQAHVQYYGWMDPVESGELAGTTGEGLRLEAITISLGSIAGSVEYRAHVSNVGWQDWVKDDEVAGTTGQGNYIESMQIQLTGEAADSYDIYYRVHSANKGWLGWARNGEYAGTAGYGLQSEAIEIQLVEKGASFPAYGKAPAFVEPLVSYEAHTSNGGWQPRKSDGDTAGIIGGETLDALYVISASSTIDGSVVSQGYVEFSGWQTEISDDTSGEIGQPGALQAIRLSLDGEVSGLYDIYYRTHLADKGWMDWASNGESAGSVGYGRHIDAVQVVMVEKGGSAPGATAKPFEENASFNYRAHVQNYGWMDLVESGELAGTTGEGLRLEALSISLGEASGSVEYRAHVSNVGWQDWVSDGQIGGTTGQGNAIEALQIQLSGEAADSYDVYYRVHSANKGWLGWAKNGEYAGTAGYGLQAEAIEIQLVDKGASFPDYGKQQAYVEPLVTYEAHAQYYGWMGTVNDGETAGTVGEGLALEAIWIKSASATVPGSVISQGYVEFSGWQDEVENGTSGTTGQSRALQAFKLSLAGEIADSYDIYYRAHVSNVGWMDWAKNGEPAGSVGYGKHLEAYEVIMVPKGQAAPGATDKPYEENALFHYQAYVQGTGWMWPVGSGVMAGSTGKSLRLEGLSISLGAESGSVEYRTHVANVGWQDWVKDEQIAGTPGEGNAIEAIQIQLSGDAAEKYDIYYRLHSAGFGWLGWAKNGELAGTSGCSMRAEAIEIELVDKGAPAPGSTDGAYRELSYSYSINSKWKGWQDPVSGGRTAGEGGYPIYQIVPTTDLTGFTGEMQISAHSANIGWQDWVGSGDIAGVEGNQIEAIKVRLTGELGEYFDVYYRVHAENFGWMGWTKNGEPAGTSSLSYAAEAIQIEILPKFVDGPEQKGIAYRSWVLSDVIDSLNSFYGNGWYVFGTNRSLSSYANWLIDEAIANYTYGGCDVAFVMVDLETGAGVAYRSNTIYTSCCTVKAPYIVSLNKYWPWTLDESEDNMYWSLYNSTNETYYALIDRYGKQTMNWFLDETDAYCGWYAPEYFASYTPKDLAKMWCGIADYLLGDNSYNAAWLRDLLSDNVAVDIPRALSDADVVYAKAGWISDVHNEGALVIRDGHPFVIAIMSSSSPSAEYRMREMASALDYAHTELIS
ncbi:MAG: hypothetical protein E7003_04190 [Eggerthellaceae bacterium]|nr:hypothetical protein [Eggerthellaceae bacterium]